MPHSYVKIWVHAVWRTKYSRPYLQKEIESKVYAFIKAEFEAMDCAVNIIGGIENHIHVLFKLNSKYSLSNVIKTVKGKSSNWIRSENLTENKFEWQTGYYAASVDEVNKDRVFYYIRNQKLHHKRQSLDNEMIELQSE